MTTKEDNSHVITQDYFKCIYCGEEILFKGILVTDHSIKLYQKNGCNHYMKKIKEEKRKEY